MSNLAIQNPYQAGSLNGLDTGSFGAGNAGQEQLMLELLQEILQILNQTYQNQNGSSGGGGGTPAVGGAGAPSVPAPSGGGFAPPAPASAGSGGTPPASTPSVGAASPSSTNGAVGGPSSVDLSGFGSLQLPSGSNGHVDTISGGQLGNYNSQYFQHNGNGSITLTVPSGGGAHTANSNFPRSELAENGTWKMSSGTSTLSGTVSIDKLPPDGDVVFGQIHQQVSSGKPRPPVELHYDKGNIVASVMDSNSPNAGRHNVTIATGVKPGEKFSYDMQMKPNGQLNITAAGHSKSIQLDPSFNNSNMYFKAGNYCQDPAGGSAVTVYGLGISHTK